MKRSYQTMIFATLCLAAMVSPVAVQAQGDDYEEELMVGYFGPDESWPEVSSTIENWPADDPSGYEEYVKQKWREYDDGVESERWTESALYTLVSDRAGECEPIPPEEWSSPITVSGVSQDCQKQMEEYPGGITGEEESVFDVMTGSMTDPVMMLRFGDDLLFCDNSLLSRAAVESACWPNDNPILGGKYNFLRITMKGPLLCEKLSVLNEYWRGLDDDDCWPCDPPLPMEFTNATIVMDWRICSEEEGVVTRSYPWPATGARIVDPPPP